MQQQQHSSSPLLAVDATKSVLIAPFPKVEDTANAVLVAFDLASGTLTIQASKKKKINLQI